MMKKLLMILPVACALSLLVACKMDLSLNSGRKIDPSANIVRNEYPMATFNEVEIDVVANVKFIQSRRGEYRVVLSAPDNYVDLFRFESKGGELDVKFAKRGINIDPTDVDITIYSPTLRELDNAGLANVEIDSIRVPKLKLENSGVGKLYVSGISATSFKAECSGVGGMELSGRADVAELECSGVGSISARQLQVKRLKAEISGVGGIHCHATESIEAEVSGVGSLKYAGSPRTKQLNRTGVGSITAVK